MTKKEKLEKAVLDGFQECMNSKMMKPTAPVGYAMATQQFFAGMLLSKTIMETITGEGKAKMQADLEAIIQSYLQKSQNIIDDFVASLNLQKAAFVPKSQKN